MQTTLEARVRDTPEGQEADGILRKCVHCGFCNATCPTYRILGDELDGPRGRIYLIKRMLEGEAVTAETRTHLDRCLTCRNCETTCPSGVAYGRLAEIGRETLEQRAPRLWHERLLRRSLVAFLLSGTLLHITMALARVVRPMLPARLRRKVPFTDLARGWPRSLHTRRWVLLEGCVQDAMFPGLNAATARVLNAAGIRTIVAPRAHCCGAIELHLGLGVEARRRIRTAIDAWWPLVEDGVEGFVMNASGCGVTVREWPQLLQGDPIYRAKAERIAAMTRDVSEVLQEDLSSLQPILVGELPPRAAFHPPCTMQHGQRMRGCVEALLEALGMEILHPREAHICCGSAGTYSLLQPLLAEQLRTEKLDAIDELDVDLVLSANVGCIAHLQREDGPRVRHWIEILDEALRP